MDHERLARLARQHAETARLLGVDFVPVYRTSTDAPHQPPAQPASAPASAPAPAPAPVRPPPSAPVVEAKPTTPLHGRPAKQAALDALRARYEKDAPHRHFTTAYTNIVWGDGDPDADLMFIGEAPGEDEDREGVPFVGRSGQLLNKMIEAMGLSRQTVYICNVLKTRPLNNATPTPSEIDACAPYLHEQVAIVRPKAIVTLGLPAARAVLRCPPTATMGALRSKWTEMALPGGVTIPVMPTYHPAFLLRSYTPENRAKVWSDLQMVMQRLGLTPVPKPA